MINEKELEFFEEYKKSPMYEEIIRDFKEHPEVGDEHEESEIKKRYLYFAIFKIYHLLNDDFDLPKALVELLSTYCNDKEHGLERLANINMELGFYISEMLRDKANENKNWKI